MAIRCFARATQPAKRASIEHMSINEVVKILKEQLNLSDRDISEMKPRQMQKLMQLTRFSFTTSCMICKDVNLEESRLLKLPRFLSLRPRAVVHKVKLLQELGNSRPTLQNISHMYRDMERTVAHFKEGQNIAPELNIAQHVFDKIGHPLPKSSYLLSMSESMKFNAYYKQLQIYFRTQILKLPVLNNVSMKVMARASFQLAMEMMDVLRNEIGLDIKFIQKYPSVLSYLPASARALMEVFEELRIADAEFKDLVIKHRDVLNADPGTVKDLYEYIKERNISDQAVLNCLRIFMLNLEEFKRRLNLYMSIPEICPWKGHPRLLCLIYHHRIVKHRLHYLRLSNRANDANVHVLCSSRRFFQRYLNGETNRPAILKHLRHILNEEFDENRVVRVILRIKEHPYWRNACLMDMFHVLQYLKQKYTEEDIEYGIHLILYPLSIVQKTLSTVEKRYTPENGYPYTPGQRLTLCVYLIEKDNHFTGDAIWRTDGENTCSSTFEINPFLQSPFKQQMITNPWNGSATSTEPQFPDLADDYSIL